MYVPLGYFQHVLLVVTDIHLQLLQKKDTNGCRIIVHTPCECEKRGGIQMFCYS